MDIAKSETLRGFTELTLFYMSGLDDTSCLFSLLYSFRSVFIHTMLSQNYSCVCS